MSFSFPAYRELKQYLGRMDSMIEVTELSARHLIADALEHGKVDDFIAGLTDRHGIVVNLNELDSFRDHLAQTYIVIVYQSAERFFYNFRKEHIELFQKKWNGEDSNLESALKNICDSAEISRQRIGKDLVTLFEYYYRVRNWVSHPRKNLKPKAVEAFEAIAEWEQDRKETYGTLNAPNMPDDLSVDDLIMFIRTCKEIAFQMSSIAELLPSS